MVFSFSGNESIDDFIQYENMHMECSHSNQGQNWKASKLFISRNTHKIQSDWEWCLQPVKSMRNEEVILFDFKNS